MCTHGSYVVNVFWYGRLLVEHECTSPSLIQYRNINAKQNAKTTNTCLFSSTHAISSFQYPGFLMSLARKSMSCLGWCDKSKSRNHRTQSRHESSLWVFDLSNIIIHIQPPSTHPNSSIWCGLRSAASYGTSTVKPMSCEQARVPWKSCCSAKEKYVQLLKK